MRDRDVNEDPNPNSSGEPAPIDAPELLMAAVAKEPPPTDDPPAPPPPTPGDKHS
jgi:hypothetical protein